MTKRSVAECGGWPCWRMACVVVVVLLRAGAVSGQSSVSVQNNSSQTITAQIALAGGCYGIGAGSWTGWQTLTNLAGSTTLLPGTYGFFEQPYGGGGDYLEVNSCFVVAFGGNAVQGTGANGYAVAWASACSANAVALGSGATFNVTGVLTITGSPYVIASYTNSGCVTVQNQSQNTQYYQWGDMDTVTGSSQTYSGCGSQVSVTVPTAGGGIASAMGPGNMGGTEWFAVPPGQWVTVCVASVTNNTNPHTFCALQAPAGLVPCGLALGQSACVQLCNDGVPVTGVGQPGVCTSMSQSGPPTGAAGTVNTSPTNNAATGTNYGTNGIPWGGGTNLLTDYHGEQGFATLNGDLGVLNANLLNQGAVQNGLLSNINAAILHISNGSIAITNWPTNFPDAQVITNTGSLASNINAAANPSTNWSQYLSSGGGPVGLVGMGSNLMGSSGFTASVSNMAGAVANFTSVIPTNTGNGGGADGVNFLVGNDASGTPLYMQVATSSLSDTVINLMRACRAVVLFVLTIGAFMYCQEATYEAMVAVFQTPQMQGNKSEILGTNAATEIPTALAYLGMFFSFMAVFPGILVAFWPTLYSTGGLGSVGASLDALTGSTAYRMATLLFPVDGALTLVVEVIVYRLVIIRVPTWVALGVKQSMIA